MITSISLSNFKSFSEKITVSLNDLQVIVGPNSCGKTTLIQALLLLAQTLDTQRQDIALDLGGRYVQFSEFRDIVFGRPANYLAKFTVEFNLIVKETDPWTLLERARTNPPNLLEIINEISLRRRGLQHAPDDLLIERNARFRIIFGAQRDGKPIVQQMFFEKTFNGFVMVQHLIEKTGIGRYRVTGSTTPEQDRDEASINKAMERIRLIAEMGEKSTTDTLIRQRITSGSVTQKTGLNTFIQGILRHYGIDWLKSSEELMSIRREIDSLRLPHVRSWSHDLAAEAIALARDILLLSTRDKSESSTIIPLGLEHFFPSISYYGVRAYDPRAEEYLPLYQNLFSDTAREVRRYLRSLEYLGPLRARPERVYLPTGTPPDIGNAGENAVPLLWLEQNTKVLTKTKPGQQPAWKRLDRAVQEWFNEFGIAQSLHVTKPKRVVYQAELDGPIGSDTKVTIADVGFGVSQLLPVVVAGLRAPANTTLIFEQPEIHLHPRLQAKLADFFICLVELGKNVIVETHSEHLVNMLRLRIVLDETGILQKRVGVLFVQSYGQNMKKPSNTPSNVGSFVENLQLDEYGQITNWPEGFFSEHGDLNEQIIKAMMTRHSRGR